MIKFPSETVFETRATGIKKAFLNQLYYIGRRSFSKKWSLIMIICFYGNNDSSVNIEDLKLFKKEVEVALANFKGTIMLISNDIKNNSFIASSLFQKKSPSWILQQFPILPSLKVLFKYPLTLEAYRSFVNQLRRSSETRWIILWNSLRLSLFYICCLALRMLQLSRGQEGLSQYLQSKSENYVTSQLNVYLCSLSIQMVRHSFVTSAIRYVERIKPPTGCKILYFI
jgi:hypothetical protein